MTTNNSTPPCTKADLLDLHTDFAILKEAYSNLCAFSGDFTEMDAGQLAVVITMLNFRFDSLLSQFDKALHPHLSVD